LAGRDGIDAALQRHHLDALVSLTQNPAWVIDLVDGDNGSNAFSSSTSAAVAGYPHATVPAGFVHGLPMGVSFIGTAWQDARILALAQAFEQAQQARRAPALLPSIKAD
jgi:amidase